MSILIDNKTNIIVQLRDIWVKLKEQKKEISDKLEDELTDSEKEDLRQAADGANKVYDAHLNNIAMNVKNNFILGKMLRVLIKSWLLRLKVFCRRKKMIKQLF